MQKYIFAIYVLCSKGRKTLRKRFLIQKKKNKFVKDWLSNRIFTGKGYTFREEYLSKDIDIHVSFISDKGVKFKFVLASECCFWITSCNSSMSGCPTVENFHGVTNITKDCQILSIWNRTETFPKLIVGILWSNKAKVI